MPWTSARWPPERSDAIDTDIIINEVRSALAERDRVVPAGFVPEEFARWDPLRAGPPGGEAPPFPTIANFQNQVQEMLVMVWPYRWWDPNREGLYTLANLCQDAFGRAGWTYDLTAAGWQGLFGRWTPPYALLFEELYHAINRLDRVRMLPAWSQHERRDSVGRMKQGSIVWPQDRADTFDLFDGQDDGESTGLSFDVGMGCELFDAGNNQQWTLESRRARMVFPTTALDGCTIRRGWLDFATAEAEGAADFSDTFTAEVTDAEGTPFGTFDSDDYGPKRFEVPADAIRTGDDTAVLISSTRPDSADRPAWSPAGPNYTSTYREGLAIAGPVRLIVEIDFEYHG